MDFYDQRWVVQSLGLHDPLLDWLVEGKEIGKPIVPRRYARDRGPTTFARDQIAPVVPSFTL